MRVKEQSLALDQVNRELRDKEPSEIIEWAMSQAQRPIVTTNFRPLSATLLHAVVSIAPKTPVIWVDSGYNTPNTYRHAIETIKQLDLNMDIYVPKQSVGLRNVTLGIPAPDTPEHVAFTEEVKLEPFARAMSKHRPDVWFTNLRSGQTAFRDNLDIVSLTHDGLLKVCPFYYKSDTELEAYLKEHNLTSEDRYYDPTKVLENRECGLHR